MSYSLQPHERQHARPPCPSPSQWFHPNISSSSVIPFSSCLQSFPASRSFQMSQSFASGGQSISVSASTSVLPLSIQNWFPLEWTVGYPCSPGDSQESSPTPQFKSINSLALSFLYSPTLTIESIGLQKVGHDWSDLACNTEQSLPVQRESQPYYTNF